MRAKCGTNSRRRWQPNPMAVPTGILWERDRHTAAKHTLLRRYMSAWFPIRAKQYRDIGITFFDGFAVQGITQPSSEVLVTFGAFALRRRRLQRRSSPLGPRALVNASRRAPPVRSRLGRPAASSRPAGSKFAGDLDKYFDIWCYFTDSAAGQPCNSLRAMPRWPRPSTMRDQR